MRKIYGLALILALCTALAAQLPRKKAISGRVWSDRTPASLVRITLQTEMGTSIGTTFSDRDGRYSFPDLDNGVYKLVAEKDGYEPVTQTIDLGFTGGEATVDFFLRALKSDSKPVSVGSPSLDAKATQSLKEGQQLLSAKKYKEAIAPLSAAVAAAPTYAPAYDDLGNAYFGSGDFTTAEKQWRHAVMLDPKDVSALVDLARISNDHQQPQAALDWLNRAPQDASDSWPLHMERGRAYYALGQWQQATTELNRSLSLGGSAEPQIYIMLANLAVKVHDYPQARHMFELYLQTDPNGSFAPRAKHIVDDMVAKGIPEPKATANNK